MRSGAQLIVAIAFASAFSAVMAAACISEIAKNKWVGGRVQLTKILCHLV
ncbi:hypothetical protein NBRC3255_2592 [Gluconobacter thailandicus NBRC 3255]|nr:hypothetical protein NBRC3255_2592 [Gluconobacter thailandicus NBRC 3255]